MGTKCRICEQETRDRTDVFHHLERSPIDSTLCLGCWIATLEVEKFILRATGRTMLSLKVQDLMYSFLKHLSQA